MRTGLAGYCVSLSAALLLLCLASAPAGAALTPDGVSAGGAHSCAVAADGTLACWGDDSAGQLDEVPGGEFRSVSAGGGHSCAIRTDGTLACWGDDSLGQLDEIPAGEFRSVSAGGAHTCAITADGALACWGDDSAGQLDEVPGGEFRSVSAGGGHSCAIRTDGTLACWGDDSAGQVSGAPKASGHWLLRWWHWHHHHWRPYWYWEEDEPLHFISVAAGDSHSCAVDDGGALSCWGEGSAGQLDGIPAGAFRSVSAAGEDSCAIRADGALACWGDDSLGQLDEVPAGSFLSASVGGGHICAVGVGGQLACWGDNEQGQVQPSMLDAAPPAGVVGAPYQLQFATTPQAPAAVFSFAGKLPDGLALSATGKLSGTPTKAGSFSFTAIAANGLTADATQEVTVKIAAAPAAPAAAVIAPPAPREGLPPPTAGETVNVAPAGGVIGVKCPADTGFVRLTAPTQIPLTCLIDAGNGTVDLTASKGNEAGTQSANFWGGIFGLAQKAADNYVTELKLAGQLKCEKRKKGKPGKKRSRSRRLLKRGGGGGRRLWGSGKGNYKTVGSYGSATVRGTTWLVVDRCDNSTFFSVREGVVTVRDFVKGSVFALQPGEHYLAKATIPRLK